MVEKETEMTKRPKFQTEAEEAEWLYDHRDEIDTEWIPVRDKHGKPLTPAEIRDREIRKSQQPSRRKQG
jgi:hypothetical protein